MRSLLTILALFTALLSFGQDTLVTYGDDKHFSFDYHYGNANEPDTVYYQGKPFTGLWLNYDDDSTTIEGRYPYKNGLNHGHLISVDDGDTNRIANYKHGHKHGFYKKFTESGMIDKKGHYYMGEEVGMWYMYTFTSDRDDPMKLSHKIDYGKAGDDKRKMIRVRNQ